MTIRLMTDDETDDVAAVWYRSLTESTRWLRPDQRVPPEDSLAYFLWRYGLNQDGSSPDIWVAVRDDAIVAMMTLEEDELDRLYVATAAQRQGIGTALLDHAKSLHPDGLELVTLQRNTPARRFYERHGFVAFRTGVSPPPENEPDIWYRWPATDAIG